MAIAWKTCCITVAFPFTPAWEYSNVCITNEHLICWPVEHWLLPLARGSAWQFSRSFGSLYQDRPQSSVVDFHICKSRSSFRCYLRDTLLQPGFAANIPLTVRPVVRYTPCKQIENLFYFALQDAETSCLVYVCVDEQVGRSRRLCPCRRRTDDLVTGCTPAHSAD